MKLHQNYALSIWLMCQNNKTQGAVWINCLVNLLIFGAILVFVAVSLPSLTSSTGKAKQVEARNNLGALNRAQQAYFEEKKGAFAGSIEKLGIGIKVETQNYSYFSRVNERAVFYYAIPKVPKLKSYAGAVWKVTDTNGEKTPQSILCEAKEPVATKPADPVYENGRYVCGEGTVQLGV
ncbi:MAG: type IV pilin-like G/H family protein [Oscillatoria princeps RMCB-10]|jgi:type II secretory pathway pseudopilin PulG|nr:type IV pilin-like G/H family protein [Oscillatoria princeps RMCB-10]